MVRILHVAVKGRVRFKVTGLHHSGILKRKLEASLAAHEGVVQCSVNSLTGNVLVFYNSDNTPHSISSFIAGIVQAYKKTVESQQSLGPVTRLKTVGSPPIKSRRKLRKSIVKSETQRIEHWHCMDTADVLESMNVPRNLGLSDDVVRTNFRRYGPNVLPESVPRSALSIFLEQFISFPIALVGIAAGVSILTGALTDAAMIAGVVLINAVIGFTTEIQTEKTILGLKSLVKPTAAVMRDGALKEISAEFVVPGDILVLRPGSYIAADARLIETNHLSVDESALTGESLPVEKTPLTITEMDIPLGDRRNMVYMGTLVIGGQGFAVVVSTGRFTEIGKIQALIGETRTPETPIERQLNKLGSQMSLVCLSVCGGVMGIGILRGYDFIHMLKISILLAVAAIPEGLPAVATSTLAIGIRRMRKLNVMIRHLDAVETLGSVQTICLDKTGTLTLNMMSVVAVHTGMSRYRISDGKFTGNNGKTNPYSSEELLKLIHITVLCSESEVRMHEGEYVINGSPTENALVHMAVSAGVDVLSLKKKHTLLKMNLRSEDRNFMSTLHSTLNDSKIIAVKGNPTEILSMCNSHLKDGNKLPLTEEIIEEIRTENERMAGEALRILGVAYYLGEDADSQFDMETPDGLIWLGLVGMADPIRKGVKDLIGRFHQAGIDTIMITGDQSPTAYAIGKELDLNRGKPLEILDSTSLDRIDPEVMKSLGERVNVFARVSPAHKLQIVKALQDAGKIVAMTGDGVNDGPALKAADIGIAMGHAGTDVAREVADVVLEDDNLETMIIAVSQGRTIYNNIRKSVHFLVSLSFSEIMVMSTTIAAGLGQPLNAKQLLYINIMSDIAPAISLTLEAPEPDVLSRPPRDPDEPIMRMTDFKTIAAESAILSAGVLGAYGYGLARYGRGPRAGTLAFMTLVTAQDLHAISCRSDTHGIFSKDKLPPNQFLTVSIYGSLCIELLAYFVPGLRAFLGLTSISFIDGAVIAGGAAAPLFINEARKKGRTKK